CRVRLVGSRPTTVVPRVPSTLRVSSAADFNNRELLIGAFRRPRPRRGDPIRHGAATAVGMARRPARRRRQSSPGAGLGWMHDEYRASIEVAESHPGHRSRTMTALAWKY